METGEIFDSLIFDYKIAIFDMPLFQQTALMANIKYIISEYK